MVTWSTGSTEGLWTINILPVVSRSFYDNSQKKCANWIDKLRATPGEVKFKVDRSVGNI